MTVAGAPNLIVHADVSGSATDELDAAFQRCTPSLYRFVCVRVGDSATAEDLLQQTWLQAQRGRRPAVAAELEYWLWAIVRNLVRSYWRKRRRRPEHIPLADPTLAASLADRMATEDLPGHELEQREIRDQLLLAITGLPSADQELIVGAYFERLSQAELAARLDCSPRAIEGRLYRARRTLREALRTLEE